jgi:hypothetical protein
MNQCESCKWLSEELGRVKVELAETLAAWHKAERILVEMKAELAETKEKKALDVAFELCPQCTQVKGLREALKWYKDRVKKINFYSDGVGLFHETAASYTALKKLLKDKGKRAQDALEGGCVHKNTS